MKLSKLGILIGIWMLGEGVWSQTIFRLTEKTTVVGPVIRLGDVAEIEVGGKGSREPLAGLEIGRAAPPGQAVVLTRSGMILALRREGLFQTGMKFEGSDKVEVLTQSQRFDPQGLLSDIKNFIQKQTGEGPGFLDVRFEGTPKVLVLPAGEVTVRLKPNVTGKYEGILTLQADLSVDGRSIRTTTFRVRVDRFRPVVKTTRAVEKGEKFTVQNVALVRFSGKFGQRGGFTDLNQVLGRSAAMPLAPEAMLRVTDLFDPPVVVRGQIVEALVRKGNVELSVQVRAVQDGKMGDIIQVENTDSHKVLKAKVLDEKKVLVGP
jgi:flagella basal body P-ring formation protein FlgA